MTSSLEFVMRAGIMLQRVPWRDYELCTLAIQNQGLALQETQTDEICMAAVQHNGNVLQYMKDQTGTTS